MLIDEIQEEKRILEEDEKPEDDGKFVKSTASKFSKKALPIEQMETLTEDKVRKAAEKL